MPAGEGQRPHLSPNSPLSPFICLRLLRQFQCRYRHNYFEPKKFDEFLVRAASELNTAAMTLEDPAVESSREAPNRFDRRE
jgi:hypothetical protein